MQLTDQDKLYVNEKLPLWSAQHYAYYRAAYDNGFVVNFNRAAAGLMFGALSYGTSSSWSLINGAVSAALFAWTVHGVYYREYDLKNMVDVTKNALPQEQIDAAEALLEDEKFREILLNPAFCHKFKTKDDTAFYLTPPGP